MSTERERRFVGPRRGQLYFSASLLLVGLVLLSAITWQTAWVDKTKLFAQPRFWPGVGLIGLVVFGGFYLYRLPWRSATARDKSELRLWASSVEYVAWFLVYVIIVPVFGYLLSTLVFAPALAWRVGYRTRNMMIASVVFGFATVLLFKTMLSVQIPGGLVYEYLPGSLRGFFIRNF